WASTERPLRATAQPEYPPGRSTSTLVPGANVRKRTERRRPDRSAAALLPFRSRADRHATKRNGEDDRRLRRADLLHFQHQLLEMRDGSDHYAEYDRSVPRDVAAFEDLRRALG